MHRKCLAAVLVAIGLFCLVTVGQSPSQQKAEKSVELKVLLPQANAKVTVDGMSTTGEGTERPIKVTVPAGKDKIEVVAVWQPNGYTEITRTRKVDVKADGITVVDLSKVSDKEPDRIKVIYSPTPQDVVEAMCRLAKITPSDVVFDLGCGDGRIVTTAVHKFKAKRGVGIDINPKLVKECQVNAEKLGIADKVEFRVGDVLDIRDLSDANVVMLYMGDDINLRLRPILQKTLKPGSRIVSHRFEMGDWKPLKTETVSSSEGYECLIHLWIIGQDAKK